LGFTIERMPNFKAHNKADEAHGELFLRVFEEFATRPEEERLVIEGAKEGIRLHGFLREGIAQAMEKENWTQQADALTPRRKRTLYAIALAAVRKLKAL
jgi:hypothetical protein